jgi:hypothetical protein
MSEVISSADATDIWVLTDTTDPKVAQIRPYGALEKIGPDKLGDLMRQFTESMGQALGRVQRIGKEWSLDEVTVTVSVNGEVGIALVGKAGAEGGIELTFRRSDSSRQPSGR